MNDETQLAAVELVPNAIVPIGSIIAWHKSFNDQIPLPSNWVECNGTVITDATSPYHNLKVPNLNGENRFLRGSAASGAVQEQSWKTFSISSHSTPDTNAYRHEITVPFSGTSFPFFGGQFGLPANAISFTWDGSEVRPTNMSVVWIMRIK